MPQTPPKGGTMNRRPLAGLTNRHYTGSFGEPQMEPHEEAQRREVYYSGRVQGVGFRYTASSIARQFAVTGYGKNLPDGRVELVVEGRTEEIGAMLRAIQ